MTDSPRSATRPDADSADDQPATEQPTEDTVTTRPFDFKSFLAAAPEYTFELQNKDLDRQRSLVQSDRSSVDPSLASTFKTSDHSSSHGSSNRPGASALQRAISLSNPSSTLPRSSPSSQPQVRCTGLCTRCGKTQPSPPDHQVYKSACRFDQHCLRHATGLHQSIAAAPVASHPTLLTSQYAEMKSSRRRQPVCLLLGTRRSANIKCLCACFAAQQKSSAVSGLRACGLANRGDTGE